MMDFWGRAEWLLIGASVGFVLGYIVRTIHDIKEKVDHVDEFVREENKSKWERNDSGFMRIPIVADVMLLIVLALTVWASFASQHASNEVKATQGQVARVTHCNEVYLGELLKAVNERTTTAQNSTDANAQLQKAWYRFVKFQLHIPPYPIDQQRDKANIYANKLHDFVDAYGKSKQKVEQYPYPTDDEFANCVNSK